MNSMSKGHQNDVQGDNRREPRISPAIVKCGSPGSMTIPDCTEPGTSFTVASLTLNTSHIFNPCIKLEFASNIILDYFKGTINFQVFKICNNQFQPIPIGPQWTFSRPNSSWFPAVAPEAAEPEKSWGGSGTTASDIFSFFVCDCDSCCNECCTYTVVATVAVKTYGTAGISNATLGAIVVSDKEHCC
jgi:hypothetical protein